jgi:hypothetical protein
MSRISLSGDAAGTGTFTIASPNSNSNYTLTLPTESGTVLTGSTTTGFKNRLINGAMVIDQRNAGASQTIIGGASTLAFNCDRWQVRSAGANATVRQVATNNTFRMVFTGAASVSAVAASQSIEALNSVDLAGGNATLSLVASSTSLTSLTLEAYYANTTNTFGTWGSPTVTSIGSTTVNISSTESTVSWTFAVPSAATTGIQIRIIGGALGATQTLTIGQVQLEKGSQATSFDFRSIGQELMLCQRYYVRWGTTDSLFAGGVSSDGASSRYVVNLPVQMRGTVANNCSANGAFSINDNAASVTSTGFSFTSQTSQIFRFNLSHSALGAYRPVIASIIGSNWIEASAEL